MYTNSPLPSQNSEADDFNHESHNPAEETLQDHLLWQLNLTPMSESDEAIAIAIIDAIDPNGWLTVDLESILTGFDPALEIGLEEMLAVLTVFSNLTRSG